MALAIESIKNIHISDFDYSLPDEKIARHPLEERDKCRLLHVDKYGRTSHVSFSAIAELLPPDTLLVCNDTRVINARIKFRKETGSTIEVFLLEPLKPRDYVLMFQARGRCSWSCLAGNLKRWKSGALEKRLVIEGREVKLHAERKAGGEGNSHEIEFVWDSDHSFATIVEAAGYIPIPPYLKRESEERDLEDYQTVYARSEGSVAAPTAGLHFTPELFETLSNRGIRTVLVTLHVGAGTFQPVKSEEIGGHPMHTEVFSVGRDTLFSIIKALRERRPVAAVGTTSVRTLESLPYIGNQLLQGNVSLNVGQWEAYTEDGSFPYTTSATIEALEAIIAYMDSENVSTLTAMTSIMIAPGFHWRIVDRMVTNFHQPQSTLLLLVSSFLGQEPNVNSVEPLWRRVYDEALKKGYRFLSYGDACLLERGAVSTE